MADSPVAMKETIEEWLDQNFFSEYTSCIKIHGRPILPPLMTEERRIEMRRLRDLAIEVESKIMRSKESCLEEGSSGGEAMYDRGELNYAYTSTASTGDCFEEPNQFCSVNNMVLQQRDSHQNKQEMLKEFDPLSVGNAPDLNTSDSTDKLTRTPEKPDSAESSVALTYSTDLNNYMDMTETSFDVSTLSAGVKARSESRENTPSTIRPDSSDLQSQSSMSSKDRKTTYEDLNNYLDSLLNNSCGSNRQKTLKDSNQNVVGLQTKEKSSSPDDVPKKVPVPCLQQSENLRNSNPLPLTSPPGSLQTRIISEVYPKTSPKIGDVNPEEPTNFLQECNLSPVARRDPQNSYEQKVQMYLQNLAVSENNEVSMEQAPQHSQISERGFRDTPIESGSTTSKKFKNGACSLIGADCSLNGYFEAPPRLVRSNSYTLDSPSPMLLAHMEAELKKNVTNDVNVEDQASSLPNNGPARRVWDIDKAKILPNWCSRQNNMSVTNAKVQSPKKVVNRFPVQPNPSASSELRNAAPKSMKVKSANFTDLAKRRRSFEGLHHHVSDDSQGGSISDVSGLQSVNEVLLQLQQQHNQEMQELLKRQEKEKEAIRLALLKEQSTLAAKISKEPSSKSVPTHNSASSPLSQSPPTKDKVQRIERRNTSPSVQGKESAEELRSCFPQCNKSSSISLDNISSGGDNNNLIDLGFEGGPCNKKVISNTHDLPGDALKSNSLSSASLHEDIMSNSVSNFCSSMVASFPPGDPPTRSHIENMTSSLPPEFLSLQFSNAEITFNSLSCKTQSLQVSSAVTSVSQSVLSTNIASQALGGSPRSKRKSWCSRQLFPDNFVPCHPDWVTQSHEIQKHVAACRIQAGVRGYLTRRLLKTERVQNCITTIRDTIVCALQLQRECAPQVEPSDLQLHGRLIQQLSAACEELHNIFMGIPTAKRMAIIAADRERLRIRTPRSGTSSGSRPLSRATQIVLQRKMNRADQSDSGTLVSRASSANRSRRRSWATVESRVRPSSISSNINNNCEVVAGCLSRFSAPVSQPLQRSASAGSSRKPWR